MRALSPSHDEKNLKIFGKKWSRRPGLYGRPAVYEFQTNQPRTT
jgi:hypothetical protein